jgi:protein-disulfide isomerase
MENNKKQEEINNSKTEKEVKKEFGVAQAIVIAGLIIAVAIFASNWRISRPTQKSAAQRPIDRNTIYDLNKFSQITSDVHFRGNPDAKVVIVEFVDLECPFCKRFHFTLQQALAEYGDKIKWVYKHFPLDSLHPKARKEAEAAECAAELGGEDAFWAYVDKIFEVTPSIDLNMLPQIAEQVGLPVDEFKKCLESGRTASKVEKDYKEGTSIGVRGTPFSVLITPKSKTPIEGALPYENLRQFIEKALTEI